MAGEAAVPQETAGRAVVLNPDEVAFPSELCRLPLSQGGCPGGGTLHWVDNPMSDGRHPQKKIVACKPPNASREYFRNGVNGKPICCEVGGVVPLICGGRKRLSPALKTEPLP